MCPWIRNSNCHNTSVPFCSPISSYKAPKVRHKKKARMYVELLGFIRSFFYLIYEMSRPLPSDIRSFVFPVCPRSLGLHGEKLKTSCNRWLPRCPFVEALTFSNMFEDVWSCLFITFNTFERLSVKFCTLLSFSDFVGSVPFLYCQLTSL